MNIIEKTKSPNTINSLHTGLRALGIANGDVIIVHSSLSSIGWVCGNQEAVVTALLSAVGTAGTIVMPAHTADNSDPAEWENPPVPVEWVDIIRESMPAFHKDVTPTVWMGKIAECFRTYPGTMRSDHPNVSFTAYGRLAREITAHHVLSPSLGMDTPLGELYRQNAKVLLLGVGYSKCTVFHLAEVLCGRSNITKQGCAVTESGQRLWKWYEDYNYDSDDFREIGEAYGASSGEVSIGKIGNAECRLFHTDSAVNYAKTWMEKKKHR